MTDIRAHVEIDFGRMGVAVTVYRRAEHATLVYQPDSDGTFRMVPWVEIDPTANPTTPPSFRFPDDIAKALLDALLDHYRGGHDARQLRADYTAERARVDRLLAALLAPGSAAPRSMAGPS